MAAFHATLEEPAHCSDGFILWGLTSAFGITGPAMDVKDGFDSSFALPKAIRKIWS